MRLSRQVCLINLPFWYTWSDSCAVCNHEDMSFRIKFTFLPWSKENELGAKMRKKELPIISHKQHRCVTQLSFIVPAKLNIIISYCSRYLKRNGVNFCSRNKKKEFHMLTPAFSYCYSKFIGEFQKRTKRILLSQHNVRKYFILFYLHHLADILNGYEYTSSVQQHESHTYSKEYTDAQSNWMRRKIIPLQQLTIKSARITMMKKIWCWWDFTVNDCQIQNAHFTIILFGLHISWLFIWHGCRNSRISWLIWICSDNMGNFFCLKLNTWMNWTNTISTILLPFKQIIHSIPNFRAITSTDLW